MTRLIAALALFACMAIVFAADPEPEKTVEVEPKKESDLQTANSFYGLGFPYGHGGYGHGWSGWGAPFYGGWGGWNRGYYGGYYGGYPGYGGFGFYG